MDGFRNRKFGLIHTPEARLAKVPFITDHIDLTVRLPLIADRVDYFARWADRYESNGLLGNGRVGDCVQVWAANSLGTAQANSTGDLMSFTEAQVVGWYMAVTGYVEGDESTDNGTDPVDMLQWLKGQGMIEFWGRVDPLNTAHCAAATELFGGLGLAVDLPQDWEYTRDWNLTTSPIVGGHMILGSGFDADGNMPVQTWAMKPPPVLANAARIQYAQAAFVMGTREWLRATGQTLQGFDLAGLQARLALVA